MLRSLLLTDSVIDSLIYNTALHGKIGFLRQAFDQKRLRQTSGCQRCPNSVSQERRNQLIQMIKQSIWTLPPTQSNEIKKILSVDKLIIVLKDARGVETKKEL